MLAEGKPVIVARRHRAGLQYHRRRNWRRPSRRRRPVCINSPSNPTGAVYTLDELKALGEVLRKHPDILIATDDMYEHIMFDGAKFVNILNAAPN